MDTFTIILDNLTRHGVPDALERANEIEAEMNQPKERNTIETDAEHILKRLLVVFGEKYVPRKYAWIYGDTSFRVGQYDSITMQALKSKSRVAELVMFRHLIMYLLLEKKYSVTNVALFFNRHHTVSIHARESISNRLMVDKYFKRLFDKLEL